MLKGVFAVPGIDVVKGLHQLAGFILFMGLSIPKGELPGGLWLRICQQHPGLLESKSLFIDLLQKSEISSEHGLGMVGGPGKAGGDARRVLRF